MGSHLHTARSGWTPSPYMGPVYFEHDDGTAAGGPPPDAGAGAAPRDDQGRFAAPPPPPDAAASTAPEPTVDGGTPPPPPWEGKTPEELWNRNSELIKENTTYKERYRPWEQAAGELAPEDQAFYRDFLGAVATGNQDRITELAPVMRAALDALSPAQQAALADAADKAAEQFDPFDPSQIDARIEARLTKEREERAQSDRIAEAQQTMNARLADLAKPADDDNPHRVGIPELGDPTSVEYAHVLLISQKVPEVASIGDPIARLDAAAKLLRDRFEQQGQALLKAKVPVDAGTAMPQSGTTPSGHQPATTLKEASKNAGKRLDAILAGSHNTVGS